jgi:hypothetical protein
VVLAATDELALTKSGKLYVDQGVVRKSTDGGVSFPTTLPSANGFAGGQGFYNIAIAIDQSNSKNMYLAGTLSATGADPDGGYALIDQSATDTENVTMYHTYFNQTNGLIGFGRITKASCAREREWSFMGIYTPPIDPTVHCDGFTDTFNGINITDTVNFYAPMALGPGHPNTVYFGTDRLYRSSDRGTTMTVVSQAPLFVNPAGNHVRISAIGIAPQSDKIRLVGLNNGRVFGTSTGSSTLVDVTGPIFAKYVTRITIDPTNVNVAYVALNGYGVPIGQQIWKTTNLISALNAGQTPNWAPSSNGIPDVSVNAVVVDPARPSDLYAGTDRGVYASTNGGASWKRYGVFLPNVEVYDVKVHGRFHILRAATHGLGMLEAPALSLFGPNERH